MTWLESLKHNYPGDWLKLVEVIKWLDIAFSDIDNNGETVIQSGLTESQQGALEYLFKLFPKEITNG